MNLLRIIVEVDVFSLEPVGNALDVNRIRVHLVEHPLLRLGILWFQLSTPIQL
jgi:hypothetical protein